MTGFCYPSSRKKGKKKKQGVLKVLGGVASLQTNEGTERNYVEKVRGEGGEKRGMNREDFGARVSQMKNREGKKK